jgi:hypothetical protein
MRAGRAGAASTAVLLHSWRPTTSEEEPRTDTLHDTVARMTTRHRSSLLALLGLAYAGCALVNVNVKAPESGLETPIAGGNQRQVIVAIPFQDARPNTGRCGVQKGGYGNETADAVCQGDPAEWIATLLARELRASGFTVLSSEQGARDSAVKVEGVLLKVFVEPVVGFWTTTVESDFNVKLIATSKTGLHAERTFFSKGELTSIIWPQGIFNDSVRRGTRDLLSKMVEAILELMHRYPELGVGTGDDVTLVGWTLQSDR